MRNQSYMDLIINPHGEHMEGMAERLRYIIDKIDVNAVTNLMEIGSRDARESVNLARVFEDAQVYCFEPVPYNFQWCKSTLEAASESVRSRIHLQEVAANNVTGPMDFYELDLEEARKGANINHGIASKLQLINPDMWPWEHNVQRKITVKGYRMDDWCRENNVNRIDGIWMDAQGSELDILLGLGDMLEHTQFVMTEAGLKPYYHGHNLKVDMDAYMYTKGFVEYKPATRMAHEYEVDMIYLKKNLV